MPLVRIVDERNQDGSPILEEDEQLRLVQPAVEVVGPNEVEEGVGQMFITTKRVIWLNSDAQKGGLSVDFYSIMCHAIARTGVSESLAKPCIYCQLDSEETVEMRFVPEDAGALDEIYRVMSECAILNPDAPQPDEGEFFFNESEVNGNPALQHLESVFQAPTEEQLQEMNSAQPGQFDDPDEPQQDMDQ